MYHSIVAVCLSLFTIVNVAAAQTAKLAAPKPNASPPNAKKDAQAKKDDAKKASRRSKQNERRPGWMPALPGPWDAQIRSARSKDGREFKPDDKPVLTHAAAPSIARLPDDRLIVVFEHYPRDDRRAFGSLAAVFSSDDGKTWTKPVALSIERLPRSVGHPQGPAIAVAPDGVARLVFTCKDRKGRRRCLMAESNDWAANEAARAPRGKDWSGPHFKVRGPIEFDEKDISLEDLGLYYAGHECHLAGTLVGVAGTRYFGLHQANRRFLRTARVSVAEVGERGSIVQTKDGLRSYATSPAGIISAISKDAVTWHRDKEMKLPVFCDPAVQMLKDGSMLMLCVQPPPGIRGEGEITESSNDKSQDDRRSDRRDRDKDNTAGDENTSIEAEATDTADAREVEEDWWDYGETKDDGAVLEEWGDADDVQDIETAADEMLAEGEAEQGDDDTDYADQWSYQDFEYAAIGVPIPDFHRKVNYRQWIQDRHDPNTVTDNAYDYYASLMLGPDGTPDSGDYLRGLKNLFTDRSKDYRPGPWDPNAHSDWEQSSIGAAEYLSIFRDAARRTEHVRPVVYGDPPANATPEQREASDLLLNIMLPNLSIHRHMVRQTLADAWRAPDGEVDSRAMIDAIDTSLGAAEHIAEGDFLIEMLVARAERLAVEDTARRALANEVFTYEEMGEVLDILVDKNREIGPPSQWLAGELAACLDTTQYLFGPVTPDREPRLNPERVKSLVGELNAGEWITRLPTQEEIETTDGRQITENFVEYYQRFGEMADQGYPDVTANDLDDLTNQYINDNYVAKFMLPSLSRVYDLSHRHEASRRATQLTYAIYLYESQNGDWPSSLDDLDPRYSSGARTDPFTKQDFVYRRTGDGFTLYSTSTNGRDDGGRHASRWGEDRPRGDDDEDASDDYVFWPPQD